MSDLVKRWLARTGRLVPDSLICNLDAALNYSPGETVGARVSSYDTTCRVKWRETVV